MRILHFCMRAPFAEGYSYQDNLLPEYQHKHGHDVRIITNTKTRGENGEYIYTKPCKKILNNGVELVRISVKNKFRDAFGKYPGMLKQMIEYRPDLIFIHGLCSYIPEDAIKYKKRYNHKVHIVADNHQDTWTTKTKGLYPSLSFKLYKKGWSKWIEYVERIYGTTSWRVKFAHDYFGIPMKKIDVLVMGIDEDNLPDDRELVRQDIRMRLGVSNNRFVFVSGGKMDKDKHILESLHAFSLVHNENACFLVFGSVSQDIEAEFYDLIKRDNRIHYLEYLDSMQIKKYLLASDFGVFPGRHSVLWEEAIGCGLPCLFHRYEEKDHTEVCGNCICIEQPDVGVIQSVMEKILIDREYYSKIKKNSEIAAKEFSYHTIAEKSIECCYE